jgi:hypothetical protein
MSIEAQVSVRAIFPDDELAKLAASEIKKSLKKNEQELVNALNSINLIENLSEFKSETINVEDISRKRNVLTIFAYTYSSEEPTWFAKSLCELGAHKILIRGQWDGYGRNYYFLNGEKVTKKKFDGDKPKKPLSAKDIEINKKLFLPEGRVSVEAKLVSTWLVDDIYESTGMELKTLDGITFYYKGRGQLVNILFDSEKAEFDTSVIVEFSAAFERGNHNGEYVSFAKRPTQIKRWDNEVVRVEPGDFWKSHVVLGKTK